MKRESKGANSDSEQSSNKKPKLGIGLDLDDLGAGYSLTDKRVSRAITILEEKLLPFINEHPKLFKESNFLTLKGYATGISSTKPNST